MKALVNAIERFNDSIKFINKTKMTVGYVEDLKIILAAASKQIPAEPVEDRMPDGVIYLNCPECGEYLCCEALVSKGITKYVKHCKKCGKKIYWGDEDVH